MTRGTTQIAPKGATLETQTSPGASRALYGIAYTATAVQLSDSEVIARGHSRARIAASRALWGGSPVRAVFVNVFRDAYSVPCSPPLVKRFSAKKDVFPEV